MVTCEFCGSELSTKSSLKAHQKTAKYCLRKRGKICTRFTCECGKALSTKQHLDYHKENCTDRLEKLHEQQIEELKTFYEHKISVLQDKLENIAIKASTKSTTTNNNTLIQNLQPVTQEFLESKAPNLTIEHIKKGPKGYAEYALEHPLHNRVVCVDYSRRKIKYKDEHGNTVTDPEMNKLSQQLFESINARNRVLISQYMNKLMSQVEYPEEVMTDMAQYMTMVNQGARGERNDLHHEFVKSVCSETI